MSDKRNAQAVSSPKGEKRRKEMSATEEKYAQNLAGIITLRYFTIKKILDRGIIECPQKHVPKIHSIEKEVTKNF